MDWFADDAEFQKLRQGRRNVDLPLLLGEYARDAYPDLDLSPTLLELDRLGAAAAVELALLPPSAGAAERLQTISRLLYDTEGFRGNEEDYYNPRNSYLNDVIERRLGIPITLAIVYMAVAERAGLPMFGVGAPGHFVLVAADAAAAIDHQSWYVDPFNDGRVMTVDECIALVEDRSGGQFRVSREHLRPASPWEIGLRVLRNLKTCHVMRDDWQAALPVQQRLLLLLPNLATERRDLGLIYLRCGDPLRALQWLEPYAAACAKEERAELEDYLKAARRMSAERN